MRTFTELTETEQNKAREIALSELLGGIMEGMRFSSDFGSEIDGNALQARIDAAGEEANRMQTPWFWSSYIMDTCQEDLESMAAGDAEEALYPGPGERMIYLPQK